MKKLAFIVLIILLSIFVLHNSLDQSDVYALPGSQQHPAGWISVPPHLSATYAPMVLLDYQAGKISYSIGVPMVIRSGDQDTPLQSDLPPLPCLGGLLLVIAGLLSMMVKARNSISIS